MSLIKMYPKLASTALTGKQWAVVSYYGWKYNIPGQAAVLRSIVDAYVDADKSLDVDELLTYVKKTLAPTEEDPRIKEAMLREVEEYAAERKAGKKKR